MGNDTIVLEEKMSWREMVMMLFRRILGIFIPALLSLYFVFESFERELWSSKIFSFFCASIFVFTTINNLIALKHGDVQKEIEEISLNRSILTIVFILFLLFVLNVLYKERSLLLNVPAILWIVYACMNISIYYKHHSSQES